MLVNDFKSFDLHAFRRRYLKLKKKTKKRTRLLRVAIWLILHIDLVKTAKKTGSNCQHFSVYTVHSKTSNNEVCSLECLIFCHFIQ
jgi:hypothetical protein